METNPTDSFLSRQLQDVKHFINEPENISHHIKFTNKLQAFTIVFLLNLVVVFFLAAIINFSTTALHLNDLMEQHKLNDMLHQFSLPVFALLAIIVIPLLEEVLFRLPLKFIPAVINIVFSIIMLWLIGIIIDSGINIILISILIVICGSGIAVYFIYHKKISIRLGQFWSMRFPVVFYSFTLIFAVLHLGNYPLSLTIALLFPLLIAPQFVLGLFAGYLRVRFGFFWGAALHMVHNGVFILPMIIGMGIVFLPVTIKNKEYTLNVNAGKSAIDNDMTYHSTADSVTINNYTFKAALSVLFHKNEKFVEVDDVLRADKSLSIRYVNTIQGNDSTDIKTYDTNIINELKTAYHFKTETTAKNFPHLEVYVKDSLKLNKLQSVTKAGNPSVSTNAKKIEFKNSGLNVIVSALNDEYSTVQFYSLENTNRHYTFEIPKMEVDELKAYLEKNMGLGCKASSKKVEIIKVIFE